MDRKINIDSLFIYTMVNPNRSTSTTTPEETNIESQNKTVKEESREGEEYNRYFRGNYNVRLPNGKICLSRSFFFCNVFTIRFNRITYCCKQVGCDYFAFHLETLIQNHSHVFSCRLLPFWYLLCL